MGVLSDDWGEVLSHLSEEFLTELVALADFAKALLVDGCASVYAALDWLVFGDGGELCKRMGYPVLG